MKKLSILVLLVAVSSCATQSAQHHNDDWYGIDKLAHFGASAAIAASVTNYKESHGNRGCSAARIGFGVSVGIGAAKELYDKNIKRTFWSWEDITWDIVGASVGSLVASNC